VVAGKMDVCDHDNPPFTLLAYFQNGPGVFKVEHTSYF
jgi:hypothetical protein